MRTLFVLCCLAIVAVFAQVKTYSIQQLVANVRVVPNTCFVTREEQYTFNFNGYVFQTIGIPIQRDSLYTTGTVADFVQNVFVNSSDSAVISAYPSVAASDSSSQTAYYIVINFNAKLLPLGVVRFSVTYNVRGMLQSKQESNQNIVSWSTNWPYAVNDLQVRVHLPSSFNISTQSIVPDVRCQSNL